VLGKARSAIALNVLLVLLSGAFIFPIFALYFDSTVLGRYLRCNHYGTDEVKSPSGRYAVLLITYSCPTQFYPASTMIVRLQTTGSFVPDILSGANIYRYNGYKNSKPIAETIRWLSDSKLLIVDPSSGEQQHRSKKYPTRWRDVEISYAP
jgi:hypothetical protein